MRTGVFKAVEIIALAGNDDRPVDALAILAANWFGHPERAHPEAHLGEPGRLDGGLELHPTLHLGPRGEVEAGFVYGTDATLMPDKVQVAFTVPLETPVRYPIALVAGSQHAAAAQKFIDYVLSAPGQALLAKHGFGSP